jgi:hypothetical protein
MMRGFLIILDFCARAFLAVVAPLPISRLLARVAESLSGG